jgi:hypothetical protein
MSKTLRLRRTASSIYPPLMTLSPIFFSNSSASKIACHLLSFGTVFAKTYINNRLEKPSILKKAILTVMVSQVTGSRVCLTLVAATLGPSCFLADWSETHIFNPNWPPHAKFHNGQTMSMGAMLSLATLYYTWRIDVSPDGDSIKTATVFASLYWITALAAWFFPGSLAVDPEFGTGFPQLPIFSGMLVLAWIGCWLEMRRLSGVQQSSSGVSKARAQ